MINKKKSNRKMYTKRCLCITSFTQKFTQKDAFALHHQHNKFLNLYRNVNLNKQRILEIIFKTRTKVVLKNASHQNKR